MFVKYTDLAGRVSESYMHRTMEFGELPGGKLVLIEKHNEILVLKRLSLENM